MVGEYRGIPDCGYEVRGRSCGEAGRGAAGDRDEIRVTGLSSELSQALSRRGGGPVRSRSVGPVGAARPG